MTQKQDHGGARYYVILVAATFLMASGFIAGKILLADGIPPLLLVGWRFVLAAAAAACVVFFATGNPAAELFPRLPLRGWTIIAAIGVLQTTLALGLLFVAMETISASTGAILLFSNPLWVALAEAGFFGGRLSRAALLGLALGIAGVALALGGAFSFDSRALGGELLSLGAAFAWTGSTLLTKRARPKIDNWALSFWQMLIGGLVLLAAAYARGEQWPGRLPLDAWAWFLWLAIPASTVSFGLWFLALACGGATRSSAYLFLAPLFALILSAIVLKTGVTPLQGLGGVLVGLGLWLVNQAPDGHADKA